MALCPVAGGGVPRLHSSPDIQGVSGRGFAPFQCMVAGGPSPHLDCAFMFNPVRGMKSGCRRHAWVGSTHPDEGDLEGCTHPHLNMVDHPPYTLYQTPQPPLCDHLYIGGGGGTPPTRMSHWEGGYPPGSCLLGGGGTPPAPYIYPVTGSSWGGGGTPPSWTPQACLRHPRYFPHTGLNMKAQAR